MELTLSSEIDDRRIRYAMTKQFGTTASKVFDEIGFEEDVRLPMAEENE